MHGKTSLCVPSSLLNEWNYYNTSEKNCQGGNATFFENLQKKLPFYEKVPKNARRLCALGAFWGGIFRKWLHLIISAGFFGGRLVFLRSGGKGCIVVSGCERGAKSYFFCDNSENGIKIFENGLTNRHLRCIMIPQEKTNPYKK